MKGLPGWIAVGLWVLPASGQIESGPKAGARPEPFSAFVATGDRADTTVDFVEDRKDRPTVFLFLPDAHWGRPAARFVRALDETLTKGVEGADGAAVVAVWLTDDVPKFKDHLPRVQESLKLSGTTLTVFEGSKFGPSGWSLNDAAPITAVVVREGHVVKSLVEESPGEADISAVVKALQTK